MAELKYRLVPHDQKPFIAKARARKGFSRAYNALALEYRLRVTCSRLALAPVSPKTQSQSAWARPRAQSPASNQQASMSHRSQHSNAMHAL